MLWWNHLTLGKKILFGGAFLCLAAGLTSYQTGIIGGVFLFIIFFMIGVLLPSRRGKTSEEKDWIAVTTPHLPNKERVVHFFLNVVTLLLALIDIYFLFNSLIGENYILIAVCTIILVLIFNSWLKFNPRYYNEIYLTSKIIPLSEPTNTRQFYKKVSDIKTPYGKPLMGFIPNFDKEVAIFRIVDLFWVVYFYIDNNEIHIEARKIEDREMDIKETQLIYTFVNQLVELFSFIENTNSLPDFDEINKIFHIELER